MKAFVFPGQGSQCVGMGEAFFDRFSELTQQASSCLGYDIKELCLNDHENVLNQTQYTQPALYVVAALEFLALLEDGTEKPFICAGHSLGEYSALFAAGVIDFETGLRLVQRRGELMAQAKDGGMAAVIGMSATAIADLISKNPDLGIDVANYNEPMQTVISGPKQSIMDAQSVFEEAGARRYIPLKVSAAFHSRYMKESGNAFEAFLADFQFNEPGIPVLANVTALPYSSSDDVSGLLVQQMFSSVEWVRSVEYMLSKGVTEFVEVGPGNVLAGLIRKIQRQVASA